MIFGEEKDWKEFLHPETQTELGDLIEKTKQHRSAYMQADDVKVAQVWCALAEFSLEMKKMGEVVERLETAMKGIAQIGEIAKKDALEERVKELIKPKTKEEKEQVDKIVDALMEF